MYRIIWNDNGLDPVGHFRNGNPVDNRPTNIDADGYEFLQVGGYLIVNFTKEGRSVGALVNLPVAILPIEESAVNSDDVPF